MHLLLVGFEFKHIKALEFEIVECISIFLLSLLRVCAPAGDVHSWTVSLPVGSTDTGGMHTVPQSLLELLQLSARPCDWQPDCVKESSQKSDEMPTFLTWMQIYIYIHVCVSCVCIIINVEKL